LIVDDPVRLGPHKVAVRLRTSNYKKPGWIRSDSDGTQWNVTVTIDGEYSEPRVTAVGGWTGAHAAELIINNTRVYRHATSISYRSKDADTKNSDGKDSKPKNITWSDIAPRAEEASTTSDDIRVNTRLSKPEFRP
jgi:hypothetical protein